MTFARLCLALVLCLAVVLPILAAPQEVELKRDRQVVRDVQTALTDRGYDPGPIDGIMGPATRQALSRFQQDQNLEVTGRMDDSTLDQLGVEVRVGREDPRRSGGVVPAVASGATTAGKAVASGSVTGAKAVAKGSTTGAKALAKGSTTGAKAVAKGSTTGAKAVAKGSTTGGKAVAKGATTGADATVTGAKSVARGTGRAVSGAKDFLFGSDADKELKKAVQDAFKKDRNINPDHFGVEAEDAVITLTFKDGNEREWNRAVVVAKRVEGVRSVYVRKKH